MRILFFFSFFFIVSESFSQEFPSDKVILETIYGKCDNDGESYTRKHNQDEIQHPYYENITYKIKHEELITLNDKKLLLVITEAPFIYQHGHTLGYMDIHYFEWKSDKWNFVGSIISEKPLGDISEYKIVHIGKKKIALTSIFQSSGNGHLDKTCSFYYLKLSEINFLMNITLEYDNRISKYSDSNEKCEAEKYISSYEIIESENEWFDIIEHKINYVFSKGCENEIVDSEYEILHSFEDEKYVETQKRKIK